MLLNVLINGVEGKLEFPIRSDFDVVAWIETMMMDYNEIYGNVELLDSEEEILSMWKSMIK